MVDRDLSCSNSQTKGIYWDVNNTGNYSAHLQKLIMFLLYDFIIVILYLLFVMSFRLQYHLVTVYPSYHLPEDGHKSGRNMLEIIVYKNYVTIFGIIAVCVCMYVCIYIYIYICVCVCVCLCVCVYSIHIYSIKVRIMDHAKSVATTFTQII
jgi:hypothetical protein